MHRLLLTLESSRPELVEAAAGLPAVLGDRATVFVPLAVVAPQARAASRAPSALVIGLDEPGAGTDIGVWVGRYVESYPDAVVVCAAGDRSARVDAASRGSAAAEIAALLSP